MVKIEWSELAISQLKDIYQYYTSNVNPITATRIINRIVKRVEILQKHPLSGQKEDLLYDYPEDFRYLVESNYKIIYWIETELITIATVFDCRQNPEKIKISEYLKN
ncbi:MAG: type II toxin-antitoxin system RelE/ParE family toxin [Candidatus Kapabacteria bacterium]|jgi:addiction module RelE/StbE family toxin|nr:type II toxin-antitoxin system RelE/ParE family toxin [Candidatus Kapabacteria bacterium]